MQNMETDACTTRNRRLSAHKGPKGTFAPDGAEETEGSAHLSINGLLWTICALHRYNWGDQIKMTCGTCSIGEMSDTYEALLGKSQKKRPLERHKVNGRM
jgi:hypothetical protein